MIFAKVQGQARASAVLEGLLASGRLPGALLFCGPPGTGKALMAREFSKALLCLARRTGQGPCGLCQDCRSAEQGRHPDLVNVNAHYQASLRGEEPERQRSLRVDTLRQARRDMELKSLLGGWKVAVVEDAHTLEPEAANALLKILEEPQAGSLWVLCTSERERLPRTVVSRCFLVPFAPLPPETVSRLLEERGVASAKAAALAALCEGSVSRALSLAERDLPGSLLLEPLAGLAASEALPRELPLARREVELALFALSQDLRLRHLSGELGFAAAETPLRELSQLRAALRSNADPRAVLALACRQAREAR